ncbi:alpha/beta hydrolase fold domain-containing protein [Arthrobacter sp. 2MCAF14]|uniref:alpha/beta hydrolase fold domain-containing protein n=1 Tax=Arthrobacter sp. 2MCAF14 TaxID=3232982 RepID=UPI003F925074
MSPRVFASIDEFASQVGNDLGCADGPVITQAMIDEFATLTGSDDWIHTDPIRAENSQFGGTLVHADLVLSMIPRLMDKIYKVEGVTLSLIYGSERVRITSPIPVDSKLRLSVTMLDATVKGEGVRVTLKVVVETDTVDKPVVIAEPVYWYSSAPKLHQAQKAAEDDKANTAVLIDRVVTMFREATPRESVTLEQQREGFELVLAQLPVRHNASIAAATYGGVDGYWVQAEGTSRARTGVLIHGGGYVMGSAKGYCAFAAEVSAATGARIFVAEYRLAPEHPFPAGVDDTRRVLAAALDEVGPQSCFAVGDSAGGGLVLSSLLEMHGVGAPLPACVAMVSPLIDLTVTNPSFEELASIDPICRQAGTRRNAALYLNGQSPEQAPAAFPMSSDLSWMPPTLLLVGGAEVLRDDSLNLADKLRREGVSVDYKEYADMVHVWPLFSSFLPQGQQALDEIGAFVRAQVSSQLSPTS